MKCNPLACFALFVTILVTFATLTIKSYERLDDKIDNIPQRIVEVLNVIKSIQTGGMTHGYYKGVAYNKESDPAVALPY